MNAEQVWQAALGQLELEMTKGTFETWLRGTSLLTHEDGDFVVGVPNAYAKDWLENRLLGTVKRALTSITGRTAGVRFVVQSSIDSLASGAPVVAAEPEAEPAPEPEAADTGQGLYSAYTLETFVPGENLLALRACQAAAGEPGQYNPLVIYGGHGLGKTHLLHAVGHACRKRGMNVCLTTAETFTSDLMEAVKRPVGDKTERFREKYRGVDVLLMDDVEFLAGKEATRRELLYTLEELVTHDRRVVLTSRVAPRRIGGIEEGLRSRLEGGLVLELLPAGIQTRMQIVRRKAAAAGRVLDEAVVLEIVRRTGAGGGELQGALTQVLGFADVQGEAVSPVLVAQALAGRGRGSSSGGAAVTATEVVAAVAAFYDQSEEDLLGQGREQELALVRQIAMSLVLQEAGLSLAQAGELFGRDKATIAYARDKVKVVTAEDPLFRRQVAALREMLHTGEAVLL